MRKKGIIFLLSFIMLGMVGCTTETTNTNITPTVVVQAESSDIKQTVTPTTTPKEEATPTPAKSSAIFSTNTKENEPAKEKITKTEGLCEVLEKVDASQQATYNSFNRMLSNNVNKGAIWGDSLFCIDDSTGVIYFVNQNKDHYLYRIKDGEVMLAVAMPVKEIYPYDGSVYFMLEDYNKYELQEMHSGDIYCYTPADGKVELVYEAGAIENSQNHRLLVKEDGIYFAYEIVEDIGVVMDFYYLPFDATEPVRDKNHMVVKGWKNYEFSFTPEVVLRSRTVGEDGTREVLELSAGRYLFCVVGDILYSVKGGTICGMNLETGEEMVYDFFGETIEKRVMISFVMTETDIWMTGGTLLYRLDLESKKVSSCKVSKGDDKFYEIDTLYTDGKQLYATCSTGRDFSFARVFTDKVEVTEHGNSIMRIEFLTE